MKAIAFVLFIIGLTVARAVEPSQVIELWPKEVPGEKGNLPEEQNMTKPDGGKVAGKPVIRLGNVSKPTISIFRPSPEKDTGTTALVFPGGGYNILAFDLEGTEACEWLNSIGVTAILLKYRVPKREGLPQHAAPLQDAQRAFGLVRHRAAELRLDPKRLGVVGFSAGGHLAAALASSIEQRTYPKMDAADEASCRPDFSIMIHPGYLTLKDEGNKLSSEVKMTTNHPPTFLVMSQDDSARVENAIYYFLALKEAKVPSEMHIYPTGGHGYGLRRTKHYVTGWTDRATDWLRSRELLEEK